MTALVCMVLISGMGVRADGVSAIGAPPLTNRGHLRVVDIGRTGLGYWRSPCTFASVRDNATKP